MQCADLFNGEDYRLINEKEQFITFESNRSYLMSNSSLFGSNAQTTQSILHNINLLKSKGITPLEYTNQLSSLLEKDSTHLSKSYYKKYTDFGTIYALFDQLLQDRHLVTSNDIILRLLDNPDCIDLLAKTSMDHSSPQSIYSFLPSIELNSSASLTHYIAMIDKKYNASTSKVISMKDVQQWKQDKKDKPIQPSIKSWDSPSIDNSIRLNECYSTVDEQQDIIDKIKTILNSNVSITSSYPSLSPLLTSVISSETYQKVQQLVCENRVQNHVMNHVIGVFFKTRKEVEMFASLLKAEGIPYRKKELQQSLYEGINILRVLYDPDSSKSNNFVDILQLESLHIRKETINNIIRQAHDNKVNLFTQVKNDLNNDDTYFSKEESTSLFLLINTINSLHNKLLQYPGSFLLYQFYSQIHELPLLLSNSDRQSSLLALLNELLYIEDGKSPLLETPKSSSAPFNRLHDYIDLLEFLPLAPFTSLTDHIKDYHSHPLLKLLYNTETSEIKEEEEETNDNANIVIVGMYQDISPNYYTSLFLPQLNASRIPSRRTYRSSVLPQGIVLNDSSSIEPFYPASSDAYYYCNVLSKALSAPYLSYTSYVQNATNSNFRVAKPSPFITSLLPKSSKKAVPMSAMMSPTKSAMMSPTMSPTKSSMMSTPESTSLVTSSSDISTLPYDLEVLKEDGRYLLSVSRMNKYFQCPYAFYLQYLLGMTPAPSIYLSFGTAIHACVADLSTLIYNDQNKHDFADRIAPIPTPNNIVAVLNSKANQPAIQQLYSKYQIEGKAIHNDDVIKNIMRYYWKPEAYSPASLEKVMKLHYFNGLMDYTKRELKAFFENDDARPLAVESSFTFDDSIKIDNKSVPYRFRGIFDRIEGQHNKETGIVDYKSNPSRKEMNEKEFETTVKTYYTLQAASYIRAFKERYGYNPSFMRFENIETGIKYNVNLNKVNMQLIDNTISQYIRGIESGAFTKCNNNFQCSRCEFRSICQRHDKEK